VIGSISSGGGTEKITIALANRLSIDGYNVFIISLTMEQKLFFDIDKNIRLYSLFKRQKNYVIRFPQIIYMLEKKVKENKIDILINVDVILALFSLPLKIFNKNLKIISWEHFNYQTNLGITRRDYARVLSKKYANVIITLTEQDRNFYIDNGKSKIPVVSIANFLDNIPHTASALNNKTVIAVGRFSYQKGFDILIDVWKCVKSNKDSTDWILKIIGNGEDKEKIRKKIKELDLMSSIEIIDATKNIYDYYLSSSIYVMTSRFEGFPMVLLEAKSYGLPIVSFDCLTGPRELIKNGYDGYIIPFGNIQLMANKILNLMSDESKRIDMGKNAKKIVNNYSVNHIILKWKKLFNDLNNEY
jgi:glycosyltransferase involved in cell wall biosynthesis